MSVEKYQQFGQWALAKGICRRAEDFRDLPWGANISKRGPTVKLCKDTPLNNIFSLLPQLQSTLEQRTTNTPQARKTKKQ